MEEKRYSVWDRYVNLCNWKKGYERLISDLKKSNLCKPVSQTYFWVKTRNCVGKSLKGGCLSSQLWNNRLQLERRCKSEKFLPFQKFQCFRTVSLFNVPAPAFRSQFTCESKYMQWENSAKCVTLKITLTLKRGLQFRRRKTQIQYNVCREYIFFSFYYLRL